MPDEMQLPELARSLRALGAAHGDAAELAHAAVFGPLLDARVIAAGGLESAIVVFRGQALGARIVARAAEAARAGASDAAHGRARAARARETVERLSAELRALDSFVPAGGAPPLPAAWTAQLARVFRTADDACNALALVLAEPMEAPARRGWFGRPAG